MNFAVVGAGAWGTAFAVHLARSGHAVTLAPRRRDQADAIARQRENTDYLPGIALPESMAVSADLAAAVAPAEAIFLACPAQALRETSLRVRAVLPAPANVRFVVSLAKGLELGRTGGLRGDRRGPWRVCSRLADRPDECTRRGAG